MGESQDPGTWLALIKAGIGRLLKWVKLRPVVFGKSQNPGAFLAFIQGCAGRLK